MSTTDDKRATTEDGEVWCEDYPAHSQSFEGHYIHDFCVDHQMVWCRVCHGSTCPECVEDPHCPDCHAALNEEDHDWDCRLLTESA